MRWSLPILVGGLIAVLLTVAFAADYALRSPKPSVGSATTGIVLNETEVSKHHTVGDCWMIVGQTVVNVTAYLGKHPGGFQNLSAYCGRDGTAAFLNQGGVGRHSSSASQQLSYLTLGRLGSMMDPATPSRVDDFVNRNPQLFTEGE